MIITTENICIRTMEHHLKDNSFYISHPKVFLNCRFMMKPILQLILALAFILMIRNAVGGYGKGHVTYKGFSGHYGHGHKGYGYGGGHKDYKGFSGHAGHHKGGGGYGHHDHGGHGYGHHDHGYGHGDGHCPKCGGYVDHFDHHHHK